jgi:outer membrane protein, heavy metal efflux system
MFFRATILSTAIVLAFSAAISNAVTLTTEEAASRATRNNAALRAARLRIDEAKGRLLGAGRLANPETEFEFSQNPRMPERTFAVSWIQKFPVTARLRLEKAVSRAELEAAQAEVRNAERKLAGEVRIAAVKLLTLERMRGLRGQQISNSDELVGFMTKRVSTGEASVVDVGQVELESKQLGTQVLQLNVEKSAILGELRLLLGLGAKEPLQIKGELSEPGSLPSRATSVANRADYRAARAGLEAAQQGVALARANKWEDVGVGLTAEHSREEDAPEGFERDTMLGFKVNVPLPLWNKNEGRIAEANAVARRAEKEIDAIAAQIRSEVATARDEMAALAEVIAQIDDKLLPQSRQIEDQLRASYQTGQTTVPEVVRARGRRFELEVQRIEALRDYHLAKARHRTALGVAGGTQSSGK